MATFTVTTNLDVTDPNDGVLSLREALAFANASPNDDTIEFDPNLLDRTLVLKQGELTIGADVVIDGGPQYFTIDAGSDSRVLSIEGGDTFARLDRLIITGGAADGAGGGGIYAEADTRLDLTLTAVSNNKSLGSGGGIQANGVLNLYSSTVSANRVSGDLASGGGIAGHEVTLIESQVAFNGLTGNSLGGGGIRADSVNLARSTVSGNRAYGPGGYGGGIYATGDVTLFNSTVADNGAGLRLSSGGDPNDPRGGAGGIFSVGGAVSLTDSTLTGNFAALVGGGVSAQSITVANSIVVGNAATLLGPDVDGRVTESNGHNLFGSDVDGNVPGDLESVVPETVFARTAPIAGTTVSGGVLGLNGGGTQTVALLDASTNPALGRGEGIASITTDQRGEPRPAPGGTSPDIGAFELEQSHATVVGTPGVKLLQSSSDSEALLGLAHGEVLRGNAGHDLLDAGKGADRLHGGPGGDVLIGGGGADRFIFAKAGHSAPGVPDLILDFSQRQGDRIVLRGLDGDLDQPGDQPLEFIGRHRFTDAGQVMETVIDGHTVVRVNLDDDPRAELRIELHDAIDLHRADFVL